MKAAEAGAGSAARLIMVIQNTRQLRMQNVDGKRTTKTISAETARECERRIKYYRQLQRAVEKLAQAAMKSPPRNQAPRRIASKNQATSRSRKDVGN